MTKANALKKFIKMYFGLDVDGNSPLSVLTTLIEHADNLPGSNSGTHMNNRQIEILLRGIKPASMIIDGQELYYYTFEECIDAANNAGKPVVLNLNKDTELDQRVEITNDVTINMNGCNLSEVNGGVLAVVKGDGTLRLNADGSEIYGRINVGEAGNNNGNVVIKGGDFHCAKGQTCLHLNGTCKNSNVTLSNASFVSPDDNAIQLSGNGEFIIDNCEIVGATGIYTKSGSLYITNTNVTGNMKPANYEYYGNGSIPTGDSIVVDACEYPGGAPMVKIGTGNFLVASKNEIGYYQYDANKDGKFTPGVIIAINSSYSTPPGFVWKKRTDGWYDLVEK